MNFKNIFVLSLILAASATLQDQQDCGHDKILFAERMYGAEVLTMENFKFPWLVAFYKRIEAHFFCSGSLISASHVLSG